MLKLFRKHLSAIFILLVTIIMGAALSGCLPKAERVYPNGLSVGILNKPNVSTTTVLVWANEAAVTAYTYNFANYQMQLQNAAKYFTADGWQSFITALTASGNLAKVVKNKMVVSAVATGTPIILAQGELAGRYSWKVQIPLLVTYLNAHTSYQQNLIVMMLIVRTSPVEGTRGLGIKQFIAIPQQQAKVQFIAAGFDLQN